MPLRIALIGGGPSALYVYQSLVHHPRTDLTVDIYERGPRLGPGMPYGSAGANPEHATNISSNELPALPQSLQEWGQGRIDDAQVVSRLYFGDYLEAQFQTLLGQGLETRVHLSTEVLDIREDDGALAVRTAAGEKLFDRVVICTGHDWPHPNEGPGKRYFDSPYPPSKLPDDCNHPVALRGSSLTAVDAVLTLARRNEKHPDFKLVMHTRGGLLPSVRFFLEGSGVEDLELPTPEDIERIKAGNGGFFPLDILYREFFVKLVRQRDPELGGRIAQLTLEEFVEAAMAPREREESFAFLEAELAEAEASVKHQETIHWKEALAILNYAANYPAKHFSAEDTLRLTKTLRPLVAVIIAHLPRANARLLLDLHAAGRLELVEVGSDSEVEPHPSGVGALYRFQGQEVHYQTFVDCVGQPALPLEAFPFPSLREHLTQARIRYRDKPGYLEVPGVAITDDFRPVGHDRLFLMAVPYMGGHNPDYSGLDFCDEAARRIVETLLGDAPARQ